MLGRVGGKRKGETGQIEREQEIRNPQGVRLDAIGSQILLVLREVPIASVSVRSKRLVWSCH